jgi:hypothetical protein
MSAQVQIKLLPYNYETIVAVLQDRRVGLLGELEKVSAGTDEWQTIAHAIGATENALHDLDAKVE